MQTEWQSDMGQLCLGAVWPGSAMFAQTCLSENLGSLWYGTYKALSVQILKAATVPGSL